MSYPWGSAAGPCRSGAMKNAKKQGRGRVETKLQLVDAGPRPAARITIWLTPEETTELLAWLRSKGKLPPELTVL